LADALSVDGMLFSLILAGLLAPVIEELVFRGLLFSLWRERYGWLAAMAMTSTLFGLYHANFLPAFVGSIIYTCVYLRTGSLRAAIMVHAAYNVSTWYPLLGQFIYPRDMLAPGDPASWTIHIVALSALLAALPIYMWISRPAPPQPEPEEDSHVALSR
jgi:membrane protease YdiL (CAAX protease family)